MGAASEKVDHLSKIKSKLEQTLDELNDSLNREKRGRADIEKQRRKVEGELRITQESVAELERTKKEAENTISRKEKDYTQLANKLDEKRARADTEKQRRKVEGELRITQESVA